MRNFKSYWGHAQLFVDELTFNSPPNTPFVDPLPIPQPVQTTTLSPKPTKGTNPDVSAVTHFTEAVRPDHQRWTQFGGQSDTVAGFTGPQYEIIEQAIEHDFYPLRDKVQPSTIWTFVDATNRNAGPLRINAHYGQPAVVRIHNALPEVMHGMAFQDGIRVAQDAA